MVVNTRNRPLFIEQSIATNGLPSDIVAGLTQLGLDSAAITNLQNSVFGVDPHSAAGTFPQSLPNTNLDSAYHTMAADLRSAALVLMNSTMLPGGQFRFDLATQPGHAYTIEFNEGLSNAAGWTPLFTTNASAYLLSFTNMPPVGTSAGFYRAIVN